MAVLLPRCVKSPALRAVLADGPTPDTEAVRLRRLTSTWSGCAVAALPCAPRRGAPFADRGSRRTAPLQGAHLRPLPERNSHGHLPSELPRLLARHRGGRGQEGRIPVGPGACGRAVGAALRLCQEGARRRGGSVSARWRAAHRARRALERGRAGMGRGRRRHRARRAAL